MAIQVYFFGSLVDITGTSDQELTVFTDTDSLKMYLQNEYPALAATKYFMAVNQKMILANCNLMNGDLVALMPPFSGG
jgi:molybdopterin synthase sulfur carrier subunit